MPRNPRSFSRNSPHTCCANGKVYGIVSFPPLSHCLAPPVGIVFTVYPWQPQRMKGNCRLVKGDSLSLELDVICNPRRRDLWGGKQPTGWRGRRSVLHKWKLVFECKMCTIKLLYAGFLKTLMQWKCFLVIAASLCLDKHIGLDSRKSCSRTHGIIVEFSAIELVFWTASLPEFQHFSFFFIFKDIVPSDL